ncbi:MAG: M3 family metallopeptidase [Candidatus Accumulibacter sp.]|jgi:oligopeptidase A|nr:M3 family metallopeptidase [Accumulibacter sp.]
MTSNPLLDTTGLPRFDLIAPEHVAPGVEGLLAECRALVGRLGGDPRPATWDDFAAPLADGLERLSRAWGIVGHLHAVNDVPEWREAYNRMLPEVSRFYAEIGQNLELFAKYKALRASAEFPALSAARRKVVENELRDFRLSGAELPEEQKPRFKAIQEELAALAAKFSENLLDATNAFTETVTDAAELAGLPPDAVQAAREEAAKGGAPGWKFTLHMPSYWPVQQFADSRRLRESLYRASATRASEFGPAEIDNTPLIGRILKLRQEEARMLGYRHYADVSLAPKMAESVEQTLGFLRDLAQKARPFAERDVAELREFARREMKMEALESWDLAYASEKLREKRYAFSEQEVKAYFTEPKVLAGLFRVVESLYGVRIAPDRAPVWHEDVRVFRIDDARGEALGWFYLDLYARDTKRGGAWMDEAIARRRTPGGVQKPAAYLVCNLPRPVGGKPATFSHGDVETLFHETGHGLHHLLTRVDELGVSGIRGVEWDAVELPSQFMENYCWEWDVLRQMSGHVDTGEALPRELFDKMLAARNFQSGMRTLRQIEFALFDMLLHSEFDPAGERSALELLDAVRKEVAVVFPPAWNRFPNGFSHIFAGGYAAGYYSYKWAEVLSADAYAAFEEAGDPFDAAVGRRFLDEIVAAGGERPALENFRAFRGRDPEVDALLRHSGMIAG